MRITNLQKKELSEIFIENGLNLLDFETTGKNNEFTIKYKFDYFSFTVTRKEIDEFIVTIHSINNTRKGSSVVKWPGIISKFELWTKELNKEINTPTGWENFESENYLNNEFADLNKPFTIEEKIETRNSLKYLKSKIVDLNIQDEQLEIIEGKIDELSSKIDELSKFDWKSLFIGTIASIIMSLSLPSESAGMLWEYIKSAFSGLKLR